MKKSIDIISKASSIANFYKDILSQVFTDNIDIYTYSIEEKTLKMIHNCDLYLLSATSDDIEKINGQNHFYLQNLKLLELILFFQKRQLIF